MYETKYQSNSEQSKEVVASIIVAEKNEIAHRPRRLSVVDQQQVQEVIDNVTQEEVIRPSKFFQSDCDCKENKSVIISDRGSAFIFEEFKSFCESQKLRRVKTAVYVPQVNGQPERCLRTSKSICQKLSILLTTIKS